MREREWDAAEFSLLLENVCESPDNNNNKNAQRDWNTQRTNEKMWYKLWTSRKEKCTFFPNIPQTAKRHHMHHLHCDKAAHRARAHNANVKEKNPKQTESAFTRIGHGHSTSLFIAQVGNFMPDLKCKHNGATTASAMTNCLTLMLLSHKLVSNRQQIEKSANHIFDCSEYNRRKWHVGNGGTS